MAKEELRDIGGSIATNATSLIFWFWAALTMFSLISVVLFSCTGGAVSKNKYANAESSAYVGGTTCGGECAAGCGA